MSSRDRIFRGLSTGINYTKIVELPKVNEETNLLPKLDFFNPDNSEILENSKQLPIEIRLPIENKVRVKGLDISKPIFEWKEMNLKEFLIKNIRKFGYGCPTAIQAYGIPEVMNKRDVIGCAPTGTGKTLAFVLPILNQLTKEEEEEELEENSEEKNQPKALIISPTLELSSQLTNVIKNMVQDSKLKVYEIGAVRLLKKQKRIDILITVPKRILFGIKKNWISLKKVEFIVFDEADKLFEKGFLQQIDSILSNCKNPKLSRLVYSATIFPHIHELLQNVMIDPVQIIVGLENTPISSVKQELKFVSEEGKILAIQELLFQGFKPPVLVFVQSKERARSLSKELYLLGLNSNSIHSLRDHKHRVEAVNKFKLGQTNFLITTDLLSRGLDFPEVVNIINYDFPTSVSSYIHRIGRTGRAGKIGKAITFFTEKDRINLRKIANIIKESGEKIPEWIFNIRGGSKRKIRNLRTKPIKRDNNINPEPIFRKVVKFKRKRRRN